MISLGIGVFDNCFGHYGSFILKTHALQLWEILVSLIIFSLHS